MPCKLLFYDCTRPTSPHDIDISSGDLCITRWPVNREIIYIRKFYLIQQINDDV